MMTFKQTFIVVVAAVSLSTGVAVAASLPANVKSVQAHRNGDTISVVWSQVPNAVSYRIYFSRESILNNGGNYDDFEQTPDAQTLYVFQKAPLQSEKIYIGVLAVDKDNLESEGFEVEAVVASSTEPPLQKQPSAPKDVMQASSASSTQSAATMPRGENPTSTATPMKIESVVAMTDTVLDVTFSKELDSGANVTRDSFLITSVDGTVLPIENVEVNDRRVSITTRPQASETEYVLGLLAIIPAADGTNATPSESQVRFTSIVQSSTSSSEPPPSVPSYGKNPNLPGALTNPGAYQPAPAPTDPSHLNLTSVVRKDGTYNVTAHWIGSPDATEYSLYTSKNRSPYAWNSVVGHDQTTVQYSRVSPGIFGLKVASRGNNQESAGIEKTITLPETGAGLLGIAAIAGLGAGRRIQRRKKVV